MKYLLAVDLETTGLDPNYNEIIQVAAMLLDANMNEIDRFFALVSPVYPDRALRFNKDGTVFNAFEYSHRPLSEYKNTGEVIDNVIARMEYHLFTCRNITEKRQVTLFGQNVKFDESFLKAAYEKTNRSWEFDYHVLDLCSMYASVHCRKHGSLPTNLGLKDILATLGVEHTLLHDAMEDVKATVRAGQILCKR